VVSRDYRLATTSPTVGHIYLQGHTEHTHGLTSSLLSNVAIRSAEILESIDADRRTAQASEFAPSISSVVPVT
jgi:L-ornithine N5-monooxygenase